MISMYDLVKKILKETNGQICKHCLGRKLSHIVEGRDNINRGEKIFEDLEIPEPENCVVCGNIFDKINDDLFKKIYDKIDFLNVEFDTFLVGSRIDKQIKTWDDELSEKFDLDVEPIKKELNRIIGREIENTLEKEVEFEKQDIVINVDLRKEPKVRIQINPLFIEGKYNKLVRGIPQTKWPCGKCKGKGCEACDYTGQQYKDTVEDLISREILPMTNGNTTKFHGSGREDIDVRMLGEGRPFVIEVKHPFKRKIDLKFLRVLVNSHSDGKIEINDLKYVTKERKASIKNSSVESYKIYSAIAEFENGVTSKDIYNIEKLKTIDQRTPIRVEHRRADLIRTREIKNIEVERINSKKLHLIIKCQGGLYIKELISGDNNRTKPSVSSITNNQAECTQLDVLKVHIPE